MIQPPPKLLKIGIFSMILWFYQESLQVTTGNTSMITSAYLESLLALPANVSLISGHFHHGGGFVSTKDLAGSLVVLSVVELHSAIVTVIEEHGKELDLI